MTTTVTDAPVTDAPVAGSLAEALRRSAEIELRIGAAPHSFRILTGDRPTGHLHLGHYFGTLLNRVRLQDAGVELFVLIADYQVLTDQDTAEAPAEHVLGLVLDYLAAGIDPDQAASVIFAHSAVPELNQLLLPFLSLVSVPELQRNPTVKDEIAHSRQASVSGLMLTYPVHQAADILGCQAPGRAGGRPRLRPAGAARRLRPGPGGRRGDPGPGARRDADTLLNDGTSARLRGLAPLAG